MKLYGKTDALLAHLQEERKKIDQRELAPELQQQKRELWLQPLNTLAVSGIGFVLLVDVIGKASGTAAAGISIGEFGLISGALYSLNSSIRAAASSLGEMLRHLPQAQLAHAVIQRGLTKKVATKQEIRFDAAPAIAVEGLRFSYPATNGEPPPETLKGISFEIRPGELLGIVGDSGSGKTSFVNILCGLYEPSAGTISFNGTDAAGIDTASLWANSGYLRQLSTNFWSMTLRENIAVGARRAMSDAELMQIAEETGFAEVMRQNDLTLDSVLGQWFKGGKNLSGGEQALLALTRQAASGAKFLVLDEPTAGLDQRRCDAVLARLQALKETTRVVISHDYGIAGQADRIVVLYHGMVADIGSHAELMTRCEPYQQAYERQRRRLALEDDSFPAA